MTKVRITATLNEQEWNWLKAKLNNEFLDSEIAQSIKKKIETETEEKE